ncbi:hypothetical protein [Streptomyces hygroscopicus]|uniref:hypothetical protein n=2 Tax=Streptomyces hygroscopicus TaxID=1912 RepID=UPI0030CBEC2E
MDPQSDVAERAPSRPLRADVARKGPVFVDLSGRRGRLVRHVGVLAGAACLGYSAVLGVGYAGGTSFAPRTLVPGRPVATEAFGREPDRAPEGRSGPSGSRARTDAHTYAPTQHQHRRHHSGSGRPEHSAAREPDAPPSVTTRPRPAPARPADRRQPPGPGREPRPAPARPAAPEPHRATPRHSPARPHPTRRESAAGHGSTTYRTPVSAHSRTASHQPAKPPVGSSHSRSEKPSSSAAAKSSAKKSGHPQRTGRPQGTGRTTGPGRAKSPQRAQSQRPQSRTPRAPRPQSRRPQSQQPPSQSRPQSPPQPRNPAQADAPEPADGAAGPAGGGAPAERADAPGTEGEAS